MRAPAPGPAGPFLVSYQTPVHLGWKVFARGYQTLEHATGAAAELVTMPRCIAVRSRVRRMNGGREVVAEFERAAVAAAELPLALAA